MAPIHSRRSPRYPAMPVPSPMFCAKAASTWSMRRTPRRTEMEAAISAFTKKLGWGVTAMVYFGGHAVRYQDRNFLLAVNSRIATEADVRAEGIDIDLILDPLIVSRPAGCVVILDAARKNPWQQAISASAPRTFQSTADIRRDRDLSGGPGGSRRRCAARGKPVCRRIGEVGKGPGIALQGSAPAGSNSRCPGHARPADGLGILAGAESSSSVRRASRFAPPIRSNKASGRRSRAATVRLISRPISIPIPTGPLPLRRARDSSRSKPATSRSRPAPRRHRRTAASRSRNPPSATVRNVPKLS